MKLFLLSSIGERHEDRIPIGIFSSMENVYKYIHFQSLTPVSFTESEEIESDYDDKAVEIFVNEDEEHYIVESFDLDDKVNLNETT